MLKLPSRSLGRLLGLDKVKPLRQGHLAVGALLRNVVGDHLLVVGRDGDPVLDQPLAQLVVVAGARLDAAAAVQVGSPHDLPVHQLLW